MVNKQDWQGRVGFEWARRSDDLDAMLGPLGEVGIKALGGVAGKSVLDIGCGAGHTSRALAELGADVTGVDISEDLLAAAKRSKGARYLLADAGKDDLHGPYDAVYSRFGAMFFDDPIAAWRHIRTHAKKGASLSIISWADMKENGWAHIPLRAVRPILGAEITAMRLSYEPGPFAWAAPDYFNMILQHAGWHSIKWSAFNTYTTLSTGFHSDPVERAVLFCLNIGILASRLKGISEDIVQDVAQALRDTFKNYIHDNSVRTLAKIWIITGKA